MSAPYSMLRSAPGFTLILVLVLLFAVQPVTALKVQNPIIQMDVTPGMTFKFPMAVSINTGDPAADYVVDVAGFGQSPGGSYSLLTDERDISPNTARSFVTIDSPLIHLEPGQRQEFSATISIPQGVGEGGRYALISIHPTVTTGSGQTTFTTAINVPVMLTVKGTTLTHTGAITNVQTGEVVAGTPVQIKTTLKNTGNHHYFKAFVNVTVTDSGGNVVATGSTKPSMWALIPGNEMTFTVPISAVLAPGTYTVMSEAKIVEGMAPLDTKTVSFTVGGPSTPAPTPTVSEAPTQAPTEAPTQSVSGAPTAPMTVVTTEQSPVTPGAIATRAPLSVITIMQALAAVSGILVLRRRN